MTMEPVPAPAAGDPPPCPPWPADLVARNIHTATGPMTRAVSLRGSGHLATDQPRQDDVSLTRVDDWLVVAVADGIGSCCWSHVGAAAAVAAVSDAMVTNNLDPGDDGPALLATAAAAVVTAARRAGIDADDVSTTLTIAAVTLTALTDGSRRVYVHQVGDSPALLLHDTTWTALTPTGTPEDPGNVVHAWLPGRPDGTHLGAVLPPGAVLVVATDGLSTPLGPGNGDLGRTLAQRWHTPRDQLQFLIDLSFTGHPDDRTAAVVWNPPAADDDTAQTSDGRTDVSLD